MHGYRRFENQVSNLAVATRRANELTKKALNTGHPRTMTAAIKANKNLLRLANNNNNNKIRNFAPKFRIRNTPRKNNASTIATLLGMPKIAPPPSPKKRSPVHSAGRPVRYSTYMGKWVPVFPRFNIKPKMLINPNAKPVYKIAGPRL